MSPRIIPSVATINNSPAAKLPLPPDVVAAESVAKGEAWRTRGLVSDPYYSQREHDVRSGTPIPSYFQDLLVCAEGDARRAKAAWSPLTRGDAGEGPPVPGQPSEADARKRLELVQRDIASTTSPDMLTPTAPGFLRQVWGKSAAQVSSLLDVFERRPIEPGMVEVVGGVPTLKIAAVASGPAVAVQSAENAAVQETDLVTASRSTPVATVAGQQDLSRQLLDFSLPGADEVITDALARDFAVKTDIQILNGQASSGETRGLLQTASILSVTGTVTNAETFAESIWKAYSQLAGTSGFGNPRPEDYVVLLHPRRLAWLSGGSGSTALPVGPNLPGTVVPVGSIPTNLGAGTNEDVALVVEKSNVVVFGGSPQFKVYPEVGSATGTVRITGWAYVALLVKNPTAVAKITGLTAPSGF